MPPIDQMIKGTHEEKCIRGSVLKFQMTSLAAANVGIRQRGVVQPGAFADLVLFDAATIADRATFDAPQAQAVASNRSVAMLPVVILVKVPSPLLW